MTGRYLLCLLPLSLFAQDTDAICAHAVELHRSGDVENAVPEYQKCLASRPDAAELRSNLGAALAHLGRYAEAIDQYRQALRLAPGNPGLRLNLALAYYKSGDIAKAVPELESLHREQPDDSKVLLLLADCYLRSGEFKHIIELLTPLEGQHRDDRAFAYLLGMALIRDGQVAKGQAIVDPILRDRDSGEAHYLLGTAAFMNRNLPVAVQEFQKAIEANPEMSSVQSWYGQALLLTGDADGAAAAFRKQLSTDPNDFESNEKLGAILSRSGHFEEALPYLHRAIQVRPGSVEARLDLAITLLNSGKAADARRELLAVISAAPDLAEAHSQLAKADKQLNLDTGSQREQEIAERLQANLRTAPVTGDLLPVNAVAPAFSLRKFGSAVQVSLKQMLAEKPAIVIFGSYTCPQFRSAAAELNDLYQRYRDQAQFVMVYVHEAHTSENWQSTVNAREDIVLPPEKTIEEKGQHASLCARKLDLKFPLVVDGTDRQVETAYSGWPSAVYLVGREGRVLWRSRLGRQDFIAGELRAAVEQALSALRR